MTSSERYLRLASSYCDFLGGLRWSADEDALDLHSGATFAFNEEIAFFMEGFASRGELIHFAFILHLLYLLRQASDSSVPRNRRLKHAFAQAGRPLRNAGVFCAILCRRILPAIGPLEPREVIERLRDPMRPMRWFLGNFHDTFYPVEVPPLGPAGFEEEVLNACDAYTDEELLAWFRHGRGPVKESGKALAHALPVPRTLGGVLASLLERPRLAGARPYVLQMVSTLSLPPRRQLRPQLALGGYSEVVTSGQPHHLLLSQFALDEWDFLRRYADRELLYFRREDPHLRARQELIVVLDQGVRTWGDVRLVLGAAVLALGRQAARGKMPFYLATTGRDGEVVDPLDADSEAFAEMVEGSDLSANPGLALERVLERPTEGLRDVVLLTHPLSLDEEDVRAAALRATVNTRLLTLTLDGRGHAALSEFRHGVPIPLRQFRVNFNETPSDEDMAKSVPTDQSRWTGDVEPVCIPFRFGITKPVKFDFSHDSAWLATVGADGICHAWSTDGKQTLMVLPRPMFDGRVIKEVDCIVGVAGGFVIVCRDTTRWMIVHYDLFKKSCAVHVLGNAGEMPSAVYAPAYHAVVIRTANTGQEHALDLATGICFPRDTGEAASRARKAWYAAAQGQLLAPAISCVTDEGTAAMLNLSSFCVLDSKIGQIKMLGTEPAWQRFIPLADGEPSLKGCSLMQAKIRANILALRVQSPATFLLRLFRGPNGVPLAEYFITNLHHGFALSSDGKLLARQTTSSRIEVRATEGDTKPIAATHAGGRSKRLVLVLGDRWLLIGAGNRCLHLVRWNTGSLKLRFFLAERNLSFGYKLVHSALFEWLLATELESYGAMPASVYATPSDVPDSLRYDRKRFIAGARTTVTAVLDCFGQVTILDSDGQIVCAFFVFGAQLSCWLPDGTHFGDASPSRRPPTAADLDRVGQALSEASSSGRSL